MKNRGIGFGAFLICAGIVWLLVNAGIINWSMLLAAARLWPLILVVIGLNIIFKEHQIFRMATWVIFLAVLVAYGYFASNDHGNRMPGGDSRHILIERHSETKTGELKLKLGAMRIMLDSGTENLVDSYVTDKHVAHDVSYRNGNEIAEVNYRQQNVSFGISNVMEGNECRISLNDDINWNMDIDAGAVNATFDMTGLKVGDITIKTGASNLELLFGSRIDMVNARINAGASKIDVSVQKDTGLKIKVNGGLNSMNLEDMRFTKQGNYYLSQNYDTAENRLNIDIDMGVSKFNIIYRD